MQKGLPVAVVSGFTPSLCPNKPTRQLCRAKATQPHQLLLGKSPLLLIPGPKGVPCAGSCGAWEPYKERIESFESCFFPASSPLLPGSGKRFRFSGTDPALPAVGMEPTTWQEKIPPSAPQASEAEKTASVSLPPPGYGNAPNVSRECRRYCAFIAHRTLCPKRHSVAHGH